MKLEADAAGESLVKFQHAVVFGEIEPLPVQRGHAGLSARVAAETCGRNVRHYLDQPGHLDSWRSVLRISTVGANIGSVQLSEGTQVTPSVRLLKPLGAGGMGAVWVADHLTLHTRVVVKFMSVELAANEEARARFSREAAAAAAVKSPHVVQVFDHGIADGSPFIVMELLEGEDLRARLDRKRVLPLEEIEHILNQACKALGQAHRAGIVHRDIKPDNIFLCIGEEGDVFVKLLDFGIAKVANNGNVGATKTGVFMGTAYYMSPEQAVESKNVDARSDIWSLGVVIFEAMTGQKPFNGNSIGALAVAITHGVIPKPSQVQPSLPASVDDWFVRACAREVSDRFESTREMSESFRNAIAASSVAATVPARPAASPPQESALPSLFEDTSASRSSGPGAVREPDAGKGAASTTTSPTSRRSVASSHPEEVRPRRGGRWVGVGFGVAVLGIAAFSAFEVNQREPANGIPRAQSGPSTIMPPSSLETAVPAAAAATLPRRSSP